MNPSSQYHQKQNHSILLIFIILFLLLTSICCENNISQKNGQQNINEINMKLLELPAVSEDLIIEHKGYFIQYSEFHEQAIWVAYLLTREEVFCTTSRTDDFRSDSLVLSGSATNEDYDKSGYARGHLKPAADSKASKEEMSASFILSNISPMTKGFNEGLWLDLENKVRDWAILYDSLFIVTGPILTDNLEHIGLNRVSIPQYFYKALIDVSGEEYRGIAFLIPHIVEEGDPMDFAITIDSLESILDLDLFYNLPDSLENLLESSIIF